MFAVKGLHLAGPHDNMVGQFDVNACEHGGCGWSLGRCLGQEWRQAARSTPQQQVAIAAPARPAGWLWLSCFVN